MHQKSDLLRNYAYILTVLIACTYIQFMTTSFYKSEFSVKPVKDEQVFYDKLCFLLIERVCIYAREQIFRQLLNVQAATKAQCRAEATKREKPLL